MHERCGEIWNFSTCGVISNFSTWQMWRNLNFFHMSSNFRFLLMTDVETSEISPLLACVWCGKCLHICTIYAVLLVFVAIYALLSRNLFCRELRTFVWRKIESKIASVEKKWQISGMISTPLIKDTSSPHLNFPANMESWLVWKDLVVGKRVRIASGKIISRGLKWEKPF